MVNALVFDFAFGLRLIMINTGVKVLVDCMKVQGSGTKDKVVEFGDGDVGMHMFQA